MSEREWLLWFLGVAMQAGGLMWLGLALHSFQVPLAVACYVLGYQLAVRQGRPE